MLVYGEGHKGFHYLVSKLTVREGCAPPFPRHKTTHFSLSQLKQQDKGSSSALDNARSHDSTAQQRQCLAGYFQMSVK